MLTFCTMRLTIAALLFCSVFAAAASATPVNLVTNGSFELATLGTLTIASAYAYEGSPYGGYSAYFLYSGYSGNSTLTDWSAGSDGVNTYLDVPVNPSNGTVSDYALWPGTINVLPQTSPDGGNFVVEDGSVPDAGENLSQTINGLTVGDTYSLTFYQAAAQIYGFSGATTERFLVTFGGDSQYSDLMTTASEDSSPWELETMSFTASATSEVLSFLAVGTPSSDPPMSLLDGVSLTDQTPSSSSTPEPSTVVLMFAGLAGIPAARRFLRK